jgi:hypothetical protein
VIRQQSLQERRSWLYTNLEREQAPDDEALTPGGLHQSRDAVEAARAQLMRQREVLVVDRNNLLTSSCGLLSSDDTSPWKRAFGVQFRGEPAHGDGVKREWLTLLSQSLLNEDYGLFVCNADCTYQPSPNSGVNPDHLNFFHFAGRIVGLALYHGQLLNMRLSNAFCNYLVGEVGCEPRLVFRSFPCVSTAQCQPPPLCSPLRASTW